MECTHAVSFYGAVAKHFVPDNLKTAVTKHTKDELILQSTFSDLEDFYGTVVLPPPSRKPKGKPTVENHVRYLETHLIEKLKEKIFTSYEELNAEIKKIVAALNTRPFQNRSFSRRDAFEKYDKPCMKPLPGGCYTVCDYRAVLKIPNNYHVEYDGHYYSVFYSYCGKPAIVKATPSDIRICDQYNKLICTHKRVYRDLPRYITSDEHMPPEHQKYLTYNADEFSRWAMSVGPMTEKVAEHFLKSGKAAEQGYKACAGLTKLEQRYGKQRLEAACGKALAYSTAPSLRTIASILKNGLDKPDKAESQLSQSKANSYGITRGAAYFRKGGDR